MKLALVHDHLAQDGGAEKVLKVLQDIYPDAPTFCLVHDRERANPGFLNKDIRTSFIQRLPFGVKHYQWFLPLMPTATEGHNLKGYDVVLTSSSAFSKGVITRPGTVHICYCHTPTRYLWSDTHDYVRELKFGGLFKKFVPMILTNIRMWDRLTADRVDIFISNSQNVQRRIWKYYRRPSVVIHPPVDTKRFFISEKPDEYFLTGGRLVYYKRFDITIKAFNQLGLPLKIFGIGPEEENLKKMASGNIEFLGLVSDDQLPSLYAGAQAFIHPQEEDFGITAVESMASGRPVIAYGAGGALETIIDGVTGVLIKCQTPENLIELIKNFQPQKFDPQKIKEHASRFDTEIFKKNIIQFVEKVRVDYKNQKELLTNF